MTAGARRRGAGVAVGAVAGALLVAVIAGRPGREGPPLDPRSDAPLGTSALVALLRGLDATVVLGTGLPGPDDHVALLLDDRLADAQHDDVLDWVAAGGHLVVTDPASALVPPVAPPIDPSAAVDRGACDLAALGGVGPIEPGAAHPLAVPGDARSCHGDGDEALVVSVEVGRGDVTAIGGAALVTNDRLGRADNAALAAALLAPSPGTAVRVVDPPIPAGEGDDSLLELLPSSVGRGLLQLALAFVLYAAWRAIRLGRPVVEPLPVMLAGSELVEATGRLLARTGRPEAAAAVLRRGLRSRLAEVLGAPSDAPPPVIADLAAGRVRRSTDEILAAIDEDRPVGTDDDLVRLARDIATIHQELTP